jgi:hypothetical protein
MRCSLPLAMQTAANMAKLRDSMHKEAGHHCAALAEPIGDDTPYSAAATLRATMR